MSDCKDPGVLAPAIDLRRCEGKADCVRVCPYGVFEIGLLPPEQRSALGWLARVKSFAHGHRKAFASHPERCHACGLCVQACPEHAIALARPAALQGETA